MADLIRHMEEGHETADIDGVIDEVAEARGTYDSLDDRLDAMGDAPSPSSSTPAMDGTGAAGTADTFARGDHVHPHDTTKQDTVLGSWTPDTSATHQTPAGTDTVLEALQKIDRNQRADESDISTLQSDAALLKNTITTIRFANGTPRTFQFTQRTNYHIFMVFGFVQGVGTIFWTCKIDNTGALKVFDTLANTEVSQSTISYTVDNGVGTITISSSVAQWSYLTIIKNAEIA